MEKYSIREPAVSGQFYFSSPDKLKDQIRSLTGTNAQIAKQDVIACILPHAGYMYSGKVAADTVAQIKIKNKIVLIGPNHTGYGAAFSIMAEGIWHTPLGEVKVDSGLAEEILSQCRHIKNDPLAHNYEHSIEVELPFLQYYKDSFEIVPLVILSDQTDILKKTGEDIAKAIKKLNITDSLMIVASSDMTHYEPQAQAEKKDKEAIRAILELDEDKLTDKVKRLNISMCGLAPVVVMLSCAKCLGAKTAKLIKYQTSGDVTGDHTSVVGYAGITVY